jgi:hypothetical protein
MRPAGLPWQFRGYRIIEATAALTQGVHCWSQNQYFADLYKVNQTTISEWVRKLEELEAIECGMVKTSTGWQRSIVLIEGIGKCRRPPSEKAKGNSNPTRSNDQRERGYPLEAFLERNETSA